MENFATTAQPETWSSTVSEDAAATQQATHTEEEMVYFSLTESVEKSLRGTIKWSWVLVGCAIGLLIIEALAIATALYNAYQIGSTGLSLYLLKALIFCSISAMLVWHGIQFGTKMRAALRHRDNPALTQAFYHQSQYFKWAFIHIIVPVAVSMVSGFF